MRLDGPGGSSNAVRLTKSSVLAEEVVLGVVAVVAFRGVFGGVVRALFERSSGFGVSVLQLY